MCLETSSEIRLAPTSATFNGVTFSVGDSVRFTRRVENDPAGYVTKIESVDPRDSVMPIRVKLSDGDSRWLYADHFALLPSEPTPTVDADGYELRAFEPEASDDNAAFASDVAPNDPMFSGLENIQTLWLNGERTNVHAVKGTSIADNGSTATVHGVYAMTDGIIVRFNVLDMATVSDSDYKPEGDSAFIAAIAPTGRILDQSNHESLLDAVKYVSKYEPPRHARLLAMMTGGVLG